MGSPPTLQRFLERLALGRLPGKVTGARGDPSRACRGTAVMPTKIGQVRRLRGGSRAGPAGLASVRQLALQLRVGVILSCRSRGSGRVGTRHRPSACATTAASSSMAAKPSQAITSIAAIGAQPLEQQAGMPMTEHRGADEDRQHARGATTHLGRSDIVDKRILGRGEGGGRDAAHQEDDDRGSGGQVKRQCKDQHKARESCRRSRNERVCAESQAAQQPTRPPCPLTRRRPTGRRPGPA